MNSMKQIKTYSFANLPTIPKSKRWLKKMINNRATIEQVISTKLFEKKTITIEEEKTILECIQFYKQLHLSLVHFDYSVLNSKDNIETFKDYINYAFNYNLLNGGDLEVLETFRLVSNKEGKSKDCVADLAYPPINILEEFDLYNRANTPSNSIFYSSETIDATFRELKPEKGDVVTLGIWKPKNNVTLNYYSIESNFDAKEVNEFAKEALAGIDELNPIHAELLRSYIKVLNHEYSKKIHSKTEYIVSALLSEKILNLNLKIGRGILEPYNYDVIIYPSVDNKFNYSNLAIRPEAVDEKLKLVEVYEWQILNTDYHNKIVKTNPRQLTVASVKCTNFSNQINVNGKIVWS